MEKAMPRVNPKVTMGFEWLWCVDAGSSALTNVDSDGGCWQWGRQRSVENPCAFLFFVVQPQLLYKIKS